MTSCIQCKNGHVVECVLNRAESVGACGLSEIPPEISVGFPRRYPICLDCLPTQSRYLQCDICTAKMLDEWYFFTDSNGYLECYCRGCLPESIIQKHAAAILGVAVDGLHVRSQWIEKRTEISRAGDNLRQIMRNTVAEITAPPAIPPPDFSRVNRIQIRRWFPDIEESILDLVLRHFESVDLSRAAITVSTRGLYERIADIQSRINVYSNTHL